MRRHCGGDSLASAPLRELQQLPARVTDGFAQRDIDILMLIGVAVLIAGMNVGARNVQIHLHGEEPAIGMLLMTPLDGQVAFADSIIVSPEPPGEVHCS